MNSKLPRGVNILILTTITVVMWISLTVYRSWTEKPKPEVPPEVIAPLNPALNLEQIEKVRQKLSPAP